MSINKLALIRYKAIDECLANRRRKWTLEDLIEKVSEVLYDREGITTGVSRRTLQADIQTMRSGTLGYNAPIVVHGRKYYAYTEPDYSITKAPLNAADVEKMKEVVGVLKQFDGFPVFDGLADLVARLENNLYKSSSQKEDCIQLEGASGYKGLQHITPLFAAIIAKRPLLVEYQSFKAAKPTQGIYYPYLLKEYRNRWFLIAKAKRAVPLVTLALDRIVEMQELTKEPFIPYDGVPFARYFGDLLGVTKSEKDRPHKVILQFDCANAPYVLTKPLHQSQTVMKNDSDGLIVRLDVVLNFELEREILGFGERVKVLSPRLLAGRIKKRLKKAAERYSRQEVTNGAVSQ